MTTAIAALTELTIQNARIAYAILITINIQTKPKRTEFLISSSNLQYIKIRSGNQTGKKTGFVSGHVFLNNP